MIKTNINNRVFIATVPTGTDYENKKYLELKYITEFTSNYSLKKEDITYLHNKGDTTSMITGRSESFSITINFNDEDPLHMYLVKLALGEVNKFNNQYVNFELSVTPSANKKVKVYGKCALEFKNYFPSGKVDELQTLQFDILPQDDSFRKEEK